MGNKGKKKKPSSAFPIKTAKIATNVPFEPGKEKPTWKFYKLDQDGVKGLPGWPVATALCVKNALCLFEDSRWVDIDQQLYGSGSNRKTKHHFISDHSRLTPEARKRLRDLKLEGTDQLYSLRLQGEDRLYGLRDGSTFYLLWWDPGHLICPSQKKNT